LKPQLQKKSEFLVHSSLLTPLHFRFRLEKSLGQGTYGRVFRVIEKETGKLYAMKVVPKKRISSSFREQDLTEKTRREIQNWKTLDHQHILRIKYYFQDLKNFYIMSELCEGGSLVNEIVKENELPSERLIAHIMRSLFSVISYCHSRKIVHRDLKPENILISGYDSEGMPNIKLADFGASKVFANNTPKTLEGSFLFMAPEVFDPPYTEKCDIWSIGVIMYILLSGRPPFYAKNRVELVNKVKTQTPNFKSKIWDVVSSPAKDLLKKLLVRDPKKRLSARRALQHPWFDSFKAARLSGDDVQLAQEALRELKTYNTAQALQNAVQLYIGNLTQNSEDERKMGEIFTKLDLNGDGVLSRNEVLQGFHTILPELPNLEAEAMIDQVDINKDGLIEYSEFLTAMRFSLNKLVEADLKRAFAVFDIDGDGCIDSTEFKMVFEGSEQFTDDFWTAIIADVDIDGDGKISWDEFRTSLLSNSDHKTILENGFKLKSTDDQV